MTNINALWYAVTLLLVLHVLTWLSMAAIVKNVEDIIRFITGKDPQR